jgi:hypothetical protein
VVEIISFYVELLVCFLEVLYSLFVMKVGGASILWARIPGVSACLVVAGEVGLRFFA